MEPVGDAVTETNVELTALLALVTVGSEGGISVYFTHKNTGVRTGAFHGSTVCPWEMCISWLLKGKG